MTDFVVYRISQDNDELLKDLDTVYAHDPTATARPIKSPMNGTTGVHIKHAVEAAHQRLNLAKSKSDLIERSKPVIRNSNVALRPKDVEVKARAVSEEEAKTLPTASVVAVVTAPQAGSHPTAGSALPIATARPWKVAVTRPAARAISVTKKVQETKEPGGLEALFRHWLQVF